MPELLGEESHRGAHAMMGDEVTRFLASLALGLPFVAMGVYQLKTKTRIIMPEIRRGDETGFSTGIMCLAGGICIILINLVRLVYEYVL